MGSFVEFLIFSLSLCAQLSFVHRLVAPSSSMNCQFARKKDWNRDTEFLMLFSCCWLAWVSASYPIYGWMSPTKKFQWNVDQMNGWKEEEGRREKGREQQKREKKTTNSIEFISLRCWITDLNAKYFYCSCYATHNIQMNDDEVKKILRRGWWLK